MLAQAASNAKKKRFAIAAEINGTIIYSRSFGVEGSTAAIGALLQSLQHRRGGTHALSQNVVREYVRR